MLRRLGNLLARFSERGATAVEYGLMVGLIALVIILAVRAFGESVSGLFELVIANHPFS